MPSKKPKSTPKKAAKPAGSKRLSLYPLPLDEALRAALMVKRPAKWK